VNLVAEAVALRSRVDEATPADDGGAHGGPDDARRLQVLLLECLRHPSVHLDEPLENGAGSVAETVADEDVACPAESAAREDLRALIARGLATLTDKQRDVLVHRFGLGGTVARTLSDIARGAGISHQQAGMRERRALQRLETALAPLAAELYGAG
jgi:DNA-directed RNA polymerase sigma subunit (sigma70/sigma32)